MTNLVLSVLRDMDLSSGFGQWVFLSIGAVALFGIFLPVTIWNENRRKEREAYYRAETLRRLAESSGEGAKAALEMLREEERLKTLKQHEGLKIGGLINLALGVALVIFLHGLLGPNGADHGASGPVYLCGLIPGLIGVAMLVYVYFLARPLGPE